MTGSGTIDAEEGGSLSSEDGAVTLVIPPGALEEDTELSIAPLDEADWPEGVEPVVPVYEVLPSGTEFDPPAVLTFDLRDVDLGDDPVLMMGGVIDEDDERELTGTATVFGADGVVGAGVLVPHLSVVVLQLTASTVSLDYGDSTQTEGVPWEGRFSTMLASDLTVPGFDTDLSGDWILAAEHTGSGAVRALEGDNGTFSDRTQLSPS